MRAAKFQARVEPMRGAVAIGVDEAVALAGRACPTPGSSNAFLPIRPDQAMRIGLIRRRPQRGRADHHGDRRSFRRQRRRRLRSRDLVAPARRIIAWQRALHYGVGLGGIYKFLVFVSG